MTKLLVVDDEENIRFLYKEEFQDEGYEVTVAASAEEAMEKIRQTKPDIITLDIKMAGTDGIEFMRKLKEEESNIPVVLCSAFSGYKRNFRVWVSDAYVVKSADLTELKTIIKQLLDDKSPDLASV
ncbi:MAG: response regulator [Nitrospinae bacterium]|nr:response regulator [Nitrospinota bacterium]